MKIGQFNTRAEKRAMHLCSPNTGEPLMDGEKPCLVWVWGPETPQAAAGERAMLAFVDDPDAQVRLQEDLNDRIVARARHLVAGFDGLEHDDGHMLTDDMEDVDWLLGLNRCHYSPEGASGPKSFGQQVTDFYIAWVGELGNASKPSA